MILRQVDNELRTRFRVEHHRLRVQNHPVFPHAQDVQAVELFVDAEFPRRIHLYIQMVLLIDRIKTDPHELARHRWRGIECTLHHKTGLGESIDTDPASLWPPNVEHDEVFRLLNVNCAGDAVAIRSARRPLNGEVVLVRCRHILRGKAIESGSQIVRTFEFRYVRRHFATELIHQMELNGRGIGTLTPNRRAEDESEENLPKHFNSPSSWSTPRSTRETGC